jgi:hypothetical protein
LKVIARIEQAARRAVAMAMPRGSDKITISECACIWAVLHGDREFVCLIGSDEAHAMDMLDAIKMELDGNDLLLEDFPEALFPIRPATASPTAATANSTRAADAHRLDGPRGRAADDSRQCGQRRDHPGGRHHRPHPRHEGNRPAYSISLVKAAC